MDDEDDVTATHDLHVTTTTLSITVDVNVGVRRHSDGRRTHDGDVEDTVKVTVVSCDSNMNIDSCPFRS